jgi:hypothetical protein
MTYLPLRARPIAIVLTASLVAAFACFAGDTPTTQPLRLPKIDRRPQASSWTPKPIDKLPHFDPTNPSAFTVDLRHRDLSKLDLSNSLDDLRAPLGPILDLAKLIDSVKRP